MSPFSQQVAARALCVCGCFTLDIQPVSLLVVLAFGRDSASGNDRRWETHSTFSPSATLVIDYWTAVHVAPCRTKASSQSPPPCSAASRCDYRNAFGRAANASSSARV